MKFTNSWEISKYS